MQVSARVILRLLFWTLAFREMRNAGVRRYLRRGRHRPAAGRCRWPDLLATEHWLRSMRKESAGA